MKTKSKLKNLRGGIGLKPMPKPPANGGMRYDMRASIVSKKDEVSISIQVRNDEGDVVSVGWVHMDRKSYLKAGQVPPEFAAE